MEISSGLVIIQDNKILLGHPTGQKWFGTYSIPKGVVEGNETHIETAIRETEEELGIKITENEIDIDNEGYIDYKNEVDEVYKRVYFYTVELERKITIDPTRLQRREID